MSFRRAIYISRIYNYIAKTYLYNECDEGSGRLEIRAFIAHKRPPTLKEIGRHRRNIDNMNAHDKIYYDNMSVYLTGLKSLRTFHLENISILISDRYYWQKWECSDLSDLCFPKWLIDDTIHQV